MAWWEFNGYGLYVWGSYGVAAAAIAIESALLAARRANALRHVDRETEAVDARDADTPAPRPVVRTGAVGGIPGTGE